MACINEWVSGVEAVTRLAAEVVQMSGILKTSILGCIRAVPALVLHSTSHHCCRLVFAEIVASLMWYTWFSLVIFLCSLAGIFTVSGAVPVNCGSDKTRTGPLLLQSPAGYGPLPSLMAQLSASLAVLSGTRWTDYKKTASLASHFILCRSSVV